MVTALLGQIQGVFKKDFLFASFLPALVFAAALVGGLTGVLGWEPIIAWSNGWNDKVLMASIAGTSLVIFAYLLNGLREVFFVRWAGIKPPWFLYPLFNLGSEIRLHLYHAQHEKAFALPEWKGIGQWLRTAIIASKKELRVGTNIPAEELEFLSRDVKNLRKRKGRERAMLSLKPLILSHLKYSSKSLEGPLAVALKRVDEWEQQESATLIKRRVKFDRAYGSEHFVRGNRLGNVVESYNRYSFTRYRLETKAFWPHLQHVLDEGMLGKLMDARILLDFSLSMASLALVYLLLVAFVGPWFGASLLALAIVSGAAFLATMAFYGMAVMAAEQLGDLVRASFDLFRLTLLNKFGFVVPDDFAKQREWSSYLGQLLIYGDTKDEFFKIADKLTAGTQSLETVGPDIK